MPKRRLPPSQWPPAIGYIRLDDLSQEKVDECRREIAGGCQEVGLRLLNVFWDLEDDGSLLVRPGLNAVLTAVQALPGLVVMLPDLNHLSPFELIQGPLLLAIHRAQGLVLEARETNGTAEDLGLLERGMQLDEGDDLS